MSNSSLVNVIKISPNSSNPRKNSIKKITIHHMSGNMSVESCGELFASSSRQASSNYSVGSDGRVGMYVEEKNRAWTSSNPDNDHQAITIEVANDVSGGNWHVSDTALAKVIDLCVDICKRNNIDSLNFTGNTNGNLTMHKWFSNTDCPGPYLESKFPYIASEVNKRLGNYDSSNDEVADSVIDIMAHEVIAGNYGNGEERKDRLGDLYSRVQVRVNEILNGSASVTQKPNVDIDALAQAVIRGDYGNGDNRKSLLGNNYDEVQKRVNEILS